MKSIFIQIASYRDAELKPTIKDLLEKADNPKNLKICIAWQHSEEDNWDNLDKYKKDERFNILDIPHTESQGACWARNKIQQEYNGEKYTLQLDSHHRFVEGWDTKCINMLEGLRKKGHKKPLLTSYIPSYDPKNDPEGRVNIPWGMKFDRFIPEGAIFFLPYYLDNSPKEPIPARFYSGHFTFADGSFAEEVQHDPNLYFHGEEISIAVRAWTWGYDLFHPNELIAWHEYTRAGRVKQWDDDKTWGDRNAKSHQRVRTLLGVDGTPCTPCNKNSFGKYFLGEERTLEEWEKFAGIRFSDRSIQPSVLKNEIPMERDEPYNKKFRHPIGLPLDYFKLDDYTFAAAILTDENNNEVYRKDELNFNNLLKQKDNAIIWVEANIEKPKKYIIWAYSKSMGWSEKLEQHL